MSDRAGAGCAATWPTGSGRPHDAPDNEPRIARQATESQDDAIPRSPATAFCRDGDTRPSAHPSARGGGCRRAAGPTGRPPATPPSNPRTQATRRPGRRHPTTSARAPDRAKGVLTYEQNSAGHLWAATRSTSPVSSDRACAPPATFPEGSDTPRVDPPRSPRLVRPRDSSRNPPGRAGALAIEHMRENQHLERCPTPMP